MMIYKWETEEERARRLKKIPPKKKLEWLRRMSEFMSKVVPERNKSTRCGQKSKA